MGTILVNQSSNPSTVSATGGAATLPVNLTASPNPLIPDRVIWTSVGAAANDTCVIEDGQGNEVFKAIAAGADFNSVEQTPRRKEVWIGAGSGVRLSVLTSGTVQIHV